MARLKNAWWYLRGLLWDRHNVLKIRTLPPTWNDRSEKMVHAMFQILVDFIDQECSPGCVDWDGHPSDKAVMDEMLDHKKWWQEVAQQHDDYAGLGEPPEWDMFTPECEYESNGMTYFVMAAPPPEVTAYYAAARENEQKFEAELNRRLHRLLDLRPYMWT